MKKWAIPSLVPFWYHLVPHHQTLPNLVYKLFKPFWTTISNCIFCLNEHRKTFISKGVDFRVFNDNATKWRTHLTYFIITALSMVVIFRHGLYLKRNSHATFSDPDQPLFTHSISITKHHNWRPKWDIFGNFQILWKIVLVQ